MLFSDYMFHFQLDRRGGITESYRGSREQRIGRVDNCPVW